VWCDASVIPAHRTLGKARGSRVQGQPGLHIEETLPQKRIFVKGAGDKGGNGNIKEEVNLFKVHCRHVWNYHNESPCVINVH
jgi:hypothetical protein